MTGTPGGPEEGAGEAFFAECAGEGGALKYLVGGAWKASTSGKTVAIASPARPAAPAVAQVQACTPAEVDACFAAAQGAWRGWARTPLWRRAEVLKGAARLLREQEPALSRLLVQEVAKGAKDSKSEVVRSADLVEYCAEEGVRVLSQNGLLTSDAFKGADRNKLCLVSQVPLGVVLCIPPFNYPVNLAVSKIAPALMAGNAVVLKPPTQGAAAGVHMAQCFHKAGLPAGLLNLVTGRGSEIGDYLTQHPGANCISFTGGDTGIAISRKAGMVPLQMELGGKDACIVCEDADLDLAAKHIIKGGFSYSGQRCTAVKVVLVQEGVADALVAKLVAGVAALTVGMPEDSPSIVPVISKSSADFIEGLVMDAKAKGAVLLQEYRREDNLIWPVLCDRVTPEMRLAWEEPFGPVVPIIRIRTPQEGVDHCNKNRYALQGCVFTRDIDAAMALSDAMETGTVQINSAPARGPDHFPFQGFRDSGIGSQGITNSLRMMTKTKTTVMNLPAPSYTLG